jgi:hypothetical protein
MNPAATIQRETNSLVGGAAPAQITVAPTLRATLAEGLGRMFTFRLGGSVKSVCLFAVSVATLSWFIDSLLPLLQEASQYLTAWLKGGAPEHHFIGLIVKLALPLSAFGVTVAFLIYNAHRNARPLIVASVVPDPHPGLIIQLSAYQPRGPSGQSRYASAAEMQAAINAGALDLAEVFKSNWGQMVFALLYHAPVLWHCWIAGAQGMKLELACFTTERVWLKDT